MVYRKKYEDSYLDDELFEINEEGVATSTLLKLVRKTPKSESDFAEIERRTSSLLSQGALPASIGALAIEELVFVTRAYADIGEVARARSLWARLGTLAEDTNNRDLYYQATDALATL